MMRRSIRVERRLDTPPEAMFEILADHPHYDRFDGVSRSELVEPGDPDPNGLGAVRRIWVGPLRFEEEITVFEPPSRMDYLIREVKPLPFRHDGGSIRLAPDGAGTYAVWTSSFEIPIPWCGRFVDGVLRGQRARGLANVLERGAELSTQPSAGSP